MFQLLGFFLSWCLPLQALNAGERGNLDVDAKGQDSNKRLLRWRDFGVGLCCEPCASTEGERADEQVSQLETGVHCRRSPSESQTFQDELHFLTPWMRVGPPRSSRTRCGPTFFQMGSSREQASRRVSLGSHGRGHSRSLKNVKGLESDAIDG